MARKSRDPFAELDPTSVPDEPEAEEPSSEPIPDEPPPVLGIGVHPGIAERHYHADPCESPSLSASLAHTIVTKSEAHAYDEHPKLGGSRHKKPTSAMDFGSLVHLLTLGGQAEIVEVAADDWKKKAAQEERKQAYKRGSIPVLSRELERAFRLRDRILSEFPIPTQHREVTIIWLEPVSERYLRPGGTLPPPVLCRARPDAAEVGETSALVLDLKIWNDAELSAVERKMSDMGSAIQAEAYCSALNITFPELEGRIRFVDLIVEESTGYVNPCEYGGSMAELGGLQWGLGVYRWARALASNHWPAYSERGRLSHPQAPPWALKRAQEQAYGV